MASVTLEIGSTPGDMTIDIGIGGQPVGQIVMNMTVADAPDVARMIVAAMAREARHRERRRLRV
jgi:hypothetical protein